MKKIVSSLLLAAKAIGLKFTEEETQKLEAIENEDELLPYFDKLSNQIPVFATEQKKAGQAEIYNSMDAKLDEKLEKLKDAIGEEKYNKIKSTQGVAKLGMLADDFTEVLEATKKAKTTGSTEDGKAANAMIIELTGKLKAAEESGKTALEAKEKEVAGRYETRLMNEALFTKVSGVKDLAGEYAKEEIIRGVMIPKVHSLAKSKKLTISRTEDGSFELLNEQGTPHVDGAKHYGIDDLLLDATRDYARKSDGGGQQGTFDPGKGAAKAGSSVADQWQTESMG
ncbi:hypothetical protein [Salmonirosea aquatica]|uniref:Uncharacterized protein n=1 Tax=Salmonirosea aquatica TaxID=2654236 RepID=A0A7C9FTD1_9BACT|nr:hypothetical protein [Cytophagaceae bacterium SJW1-29]